MSTEPKFVTGRIIGTATEPLPDITTSPPGHEPAGETNAERREGHKALRVRDGKMETFDPHPTPVSDLCGRLDELLDDLQGETAGYEQAGRREANQIDKTCLEIRAKIHSLFREQSERRVEELKGLLKEALNEWERGVFKNTRIAFIRQRAAGL